MSLDSLSRGACYEHTVEYVQSQQTPASTHDISDLSTFVHSLMGLEEGADAISSDAFSDSGNDSAGPGRHRQNIVASSQLPLVLLHVKSILSRVATSVGCFNTRLSCNALIEW